MTLNTLNENTTEARGGQYLEELQLHSTEIFAAYLLVMVELLSDA